MALPFLPLLKKLCCYCVGWIRLTQDRDQWQILVKAVIVFELLKMLEIQRVATGETASQGL
jgi:hypothetical protein